MVVAFAVALQETSSGASFSSESLMVKDDREWPGALNPQAIHFIRHSHRKDNRNRDIRHLTSGLTSSLDELGFAWPQVALDSRWTFEVRHPLYLLVEQG